MAALDPGEGGVDGVLAVDELVGVSLALAPGQAVEAGPVESAGLAVATVAGARLPDVDQLGARVHTRTRLERRSLIVGAVGAAVRLAAGCLPRIVSHQALTHSALAVRSGGRLGRAGRLSGRTQSCDSPWRATFGL
jgi:hypothetical protein